MNLGLRQAGILSILIFSNNAIVIYAQPPIGKIVDSYLEGTTTQILIEANRLLNTSQTIFLHGGISATIRDLMSMRETEGMYYYNAYIPAKVRVLSGENVFLEVTQKEGKLKKFERDAIFMKKKYATVTFVEDKKALINRGSLHNVDKRDVYKVFDSSGQIRGEIELYGIGDFLSVGELNYPLEQGGKREDAQGGNQAVFVGNRKVVGLGLLSTVYLGNRDNLSAGSGSTKYFGAGMTWSAIKRRGNIFEFLLGWNTKETYPVGLNSMFSYFITPVWFRKAFFYPGPVSPSLGIGLSYHRNVSSIQNAELISHRVAPLLTGCIEFFNGQTFHLRLDLQYYYPTPWEYQGIRYRTDSLFFLGGASLNW